VNRPTLLLEAFVPESLVIAIGFAGQGAFFLRFFAQWWASERAGRIAVPVSFWWLSLLGSVFALTYALERRDLVFAAGYVTNFVVYARNLLLARGHARLGSRGMGVLASLLLIVAVAMLARKIAPDPSLVWFAVGGFGQLLWMIRFPLQWIQSEAQGRPVMTTSFFGVTLIGSLFLLAYALHTRDFIFIMGMALVPALALRNLALGRRAPEKPEPAVMEARA
jgi:lipid-A-disaccharide synthase-like uncharacterized protein